MWDSGVCLVVGSGSKQVEYFWQHMVLNFSPFRGGIADKGTE